MLNSVLMEMLLLFGLALAISSIGFFRVVYFVSISYAFSIAAMAIITPLRHYSNLDWTSALQNMFLVMWGLRLGVYLIKRESRESYHKELADTRQRSAGINTSKRILIWIGVSLLYVLMFSPSLFSLTTSSIPSSWISYLFQIMGLSLMGGGLVLEVVSDKQKSDFKAQFPGHFCNVGLYRWIRCPNYFGEILFWIGNWIIGVTIYSTPFQWVAGLVGLICIVLIMMGSTKRLEKTQNERYGKRNEYQEYIRTVPILFPFIPVYSLKNIRVFLE